MKKRLLLNTILSVLAAMAFGVTRATAEAPTKLEIGDNARIVLMGNGLGSRMVHYGHFETDLHLRFGDKKIIVRNMCDEGNTPSFRPHSGRSDQLGFPGAEKFHHPYSDGNTANGVGHFETEEEWLNRLKPDTIIAFFGFNESFQGLAGLDNYRAELDAFVKHTVAQKYNGTNPPQLALVSPTAFQNISATLDVPDGKSENRNLAAYTKVMEEVAAANDVLFIDAFHESLRWFQLDTTAMTTDGALLNDKGYQKLSDLLVSGIFGEKSIKSEGLRKPLQEAVNEKNWFWVNDFKMPNGVHVFGRRYKPYGPANYPFEIEKIREMTVIRDQAIWNVLQGKTTDLAELDAKTSVLPPVPTNYNPGNAKAGTLKFLMGEEARSKIAVPEGYKIDLWASEQEFPDLANPVQMSFDGKGRLLVATMPSYPHYKPGDARPNDKILILEDTDNDGKADKQTVFADNLHLPMGFEIATEGVYVSQGINLVLLQDLDGDDYAESKEVLYSGFDDHDTHHAISAYCADPSGAILMCEGVFLRTNVETAYGPVRGTDGGFYRYAPQRRQLERHAQLSIPNPWGVAFDDWGQHVFLHTSGPTCEWMLPGSVKPRYGESNPRSKDLLESAHRVRPTSGVEFLSSRHFPDDVQGDLLINNNIGFLGTKQHTFAEDGTGYTTKWRQDLTKSSDGNFRPVDLEVGPDGSLFIVDWQNPLIGHMQHNARDPHRDHGHGRVYRVTYPSRPLVTPAKIDGASIAQLMDNLKLPEYRSRYRTRRELRGRNADDVEAGIKTWVDGLDKNDANLQHHLVEALWVSWGINRINEPLLRHLLQSSDHRARAAAVRVLRYGGHQIADQAELLKVAGQDTHGRVQLEAIVAASWIGKEEGIAVLEAAAGKVTEPADTAGGGEKDKDSNVKVSQDGIIIQLSHPAIAKGKVKSFTVSLKGNGRTINLSEMQVMSGGKNISRTAEFTMSSGYNGNTYPAKLLVDGNRTNFMHTSMEKDPWLKVEFPEAVSIDEVKFLNRVGFAERFKDAKVVFSDGKKDLATLMVPINVAGGGGGNYAAFGDDEWIRDAYKTAMAHLNDEAIIEEVTLVVPKHIKSNKDLVEVYKHGAEIYEREGHCGTCHQPDGKGLIAAGFPPLAKTKWVLEDDERLIKISLNGLMGPITVKDVDYPGLVPMTPFAGLLNDKDLSAVLTYIRNSFGNRGGTITEEQVKQVREATKTKVGFYTPAEILEMHPHK